MTIETVHVPILVEPIVQALVEPLRGLPADAPVVTLVDCTLGGGGHTGALLEALGREPVLARHRVVSFDQDETAIVRARQRFGAELTAGRLELIQSRFSEAVPG
jgi:16S rRNA (cytosine1402-N4)-methyltransferase